MPEQTTEQPTEQKNVYSKEFFQVLQQKTDARLSEIGENGNARKRLEEFKELGQALTDIYGPEKHNALEVTFFAAAAGCVIGFAGAVGKAMNTYTLSIPYRSFALGALTVGGIIGGIMGVAMGIDTALRLRSKFGSVANGRKMHKMQRKVKKRIFDEKIKVDALNRQAAALQKRNDTFKKVNKKFGAKSTAPKV